MRVRANKHPAEFHLPIAGCEASWCKWQTLQYTANPPTLLESTADLRRAGEHKPAIVAAAHRLLIAVYHILKRHEPYRDCQTQFSRPTQLRQVQTLQAQIERLGYQVLLTPIDTAQPLS